MGDSVTGERVCVIVNPAAGKGRGARLLPRLKKAFAEVGVKDIRITSAAGEEETLARRAVEEGCSTLVAVGGDGTWGQVANGMLGGSDARLALIAAGTGNDFAKTAGVPAPDVERTARLAVQGPDARVDVGCVEGRYFLNGATFGLTVAVLEDKARARWLRGDALYVVSALRQVNCYQGLVASVETEGVPAPSERHLLIVVANARSFGGAFLLAPEATLEDGRLDVIAIRDARLFGRLKLFALAPRGRHVRCPGVRAEQAARVLLRFPAPPVYEIDGDYRRAQAAELEVRCHPRALRLVGFEPAATGPAPPAAASSR